MAPLKKTTHGLLNSSKWDSLFKESNTATSSGIVITVRINTAIVTIYKLQSARYTTHYKKKTKLCFHTCPTLTVTSRHIALLALLLGPCRMLINELRVVYFVPIHAGKYKNYILGQNRAQFSISDQRNENPSEYFYLWFTAQKASKLVSCKGYSKFQHTGWTCRVVSRPIAVGHYNFLTISWVALGDIFTKSWMFATHSARHFRIFRRKLFVIDKAVICT
jgi:hypothetical protein